LLHNYFSFWSNKNNQLFYLLPSGFSFSATPSKKTPKGVKCHQQCYETLQIILKITNMKIQFNTDKTIDGEERLEDYFTTMIADSLERFDSNITRIEVHLSDQNGQKEGQEDIQCVLEARMEGRKPLAVTCKAETTEQAVSGAIDKLIAHLETVLGKMQQ